MSEMIDRVAVAIMAELIRLGCMVTSARTRDDAEPGP